MGAIASALVPGRTPGGMIGVLALGVVGALIGGYIAGGIVAFVIALIVSVGLLMVLRRTGTTA